MKQPSHYVTDWLDKRAKLTPDRVALIDYATGSETTFAEWNERANRTANYLRSLGIAKGDRVAVYAMNRPEYLDLFWAAPKIGAMLQNLNWRLTLHELTGIVESGEPKLLVFSDDRRAQAAQLAATCVSVEHRVAMGAACDGEIALSEREKLPDTLGERPDLGLDDPWGIYYTGGTTGLPKGAVLTHGNVTWNSVNTVTSWGIHAGHKAPLQMPFFHIGGPHIFMTAMVHVGATTILVPIAISIALATGANPTMYALIIALSTSNAFILPTHQVNALIMGPGGYRVADFIRAGGLMSVIFIVVMLTMVNLMFGT